MSAAAGRRAAEELKVKSGALSHQVRGLETFLGFRLFECKARAIAVTPQGSSLYPGLKAGFGLIHDAVWLGVCVTKEVGANWVGKEPDSIPLSRTVAVATAGETGVKRDFSPPIAADALLPRRFLAAPWHGFPSDVDNVPLSSSDSPFPPSAYPLAVRQLLAFWTGHSH